MHHLTANFTSHKVSVLLTCFVMCFGGLNFKVITLEVEFDL